MAREEGNDFSRTVAETIIEQLRAGTAPWVKPWKPGERWLPHNAASGKDYRGINAVWLMAVAQQKGYSDPRWLTYNQAHEQGAQVRRGEKGTRIEFWKWEDERVARDGNGQLLLGASGKPEKVRVKLGRPRVFNAVAFNAEQIDRLEPLKEREVGPAWQRHERAEALLVRSGARIEHQARDRAFYSLKDDAITLPERDQFETRDGYYATALHELGHWTGHPSRLNRELGHPFGSENYAKEELRAEIASLMLGQELGTGHDPSQHASYIKTWITVLEKDPREIFRASADAEKIVKFVRGLELVNEQEQAAAQSLHQIIATAQRATSFGAQPDPVAQDVLESRNSKEVIAELEGVLNGLGIRVTGIAGAGASSLVLNGGKQVVRLGIGDDVIRPSVAELLQASAHGACGAMRWEVLQRADSQQVSAAEVELMREALAVKGYVLTDTGTDNIARLPNGNLVIVDPGAVHAGPGAKSDDAELIAAYQQSEQSSEGTELAPATPEPIQALVNARVDNARTIAMGSARMLGADEEGVRQPERAEAQKAVESEGIAVKAPVLVEEPEAVNVKKVLGARDCAALVAESAQRRQEREKKRELQHERVAEDLSTRWSAAKPVEEQKHPYLQRKDVKSFGLRVDEMGNLLIPLRDEEGKLWSLHAIRRDGIESIARNSLSRGKFHAMGPIETASIIIVAANYATAATLGQETGYPTASASGSGNLKAVAQALRKKYPGKTLIIAADNDHEREAQGKPNVGRERAEEAAREVGGHVLLPRFDKGRGKEWNDLLLNAGSDEMRTQLAAGLYTVERQVHMSEQKAERLAGEEPKVREQDARLELV